MSNLQSYVSPADVRAKIFGQNPEQTLFTNSNGYTLTGGNKEHNGGGKMKNGKKANENKKQHVQKEKSGAVQKRTNKTKYTLF